MLFWNKILVSYKAGDRKMQAAPQQSLDLKATLGQKDFLHDEATFI